VERGLHTPAPVEGTWRIVRPSGEMRWVVCRFQRRLDRDGTTARLLGVNIDITERRRGEEAVRETEAQKAAVMEAALDAIVRMEDEGNIRDFNHAAEATFGYARDAVIGHPLASVLVPPAMREAHRAGLERFMKTGDSRILGRRVEVRAMRSDGTEFPAEVAIVPIRREGPPIFTGYIRDITERKRAEQVEIYERAKEAAEAANRELESLSYAVAHDLRAPLRAINGFTQVFVAEHGEELDAAGKDLLARVVANATRMGEMIDSLLDLARLARTKLHQVDVDLVEIAERVLSDLKAAEPKRHVELITPRHARVQGDPKLLRLVLENLLSNSWKFTRQRTLARIELGSIADADTTTYFVRDNGAGFDMTYREKLFTAFQRLHRAEDFEGTGIGLASVARIVHRHGGRIWAEGAVDQGATFFFTLPGAPNPEPPPRD